MGAGITETIVSTGILIVIGLIMILIILEAILRMIEKDNF
jgi:hypothetical protein